MGSNANTIITKTFLKCNFLVKYWELKTIIRF